MSIECTHEYVSTLALHETKPNREADINKFVNFRRINSFLLFIEIMYATEKRLCTHAYAYFIHIYINFM